MDRFSTNSLGCFFAAFFGMLAVYIVICLGVLVGSQLTGDTPYRVQVAASAPNLATTVDGPAAPTSGRSSTDPRRDRSNPLPENLRLSPNPSQLAEPGTRHSPNVNQPVDRPSHVTPTSFDGALDCNSRDRRSPDRQCESPDGSDTGHPDRSSALNPETPSAEFEADRKWLASLETAEPGTVNLQSDAGPVVLPEAGTSKFPPGSDRSLRSSQSSTATADSVSEKAGTRRVEGQLDIDELYPRRYRFKSPADAPAPSGNPREGHTDASQSDIRLEPGNEPAPGESVNRSDFGPGIAGEPGPGHRPKRLPLQEPGSEPKTGPDPQMARLFDMAKPVRDRGSLETGPKAVEVSIGDVDAAAAGSAGNRFARSTGDNRGAAETGAAAQDSQSIRTKSADQTAAQITGWPLPESLLQELTDWQRFPLTSQWAVAASDALTELNDVQLDNPASLEMIDYCLGLAVQLNQYAESLVAEDIDLASRLSRLAYRLRRRMEVWKTVHQVASSDLAFEPANDARIVANTIANRQASIDFGNISPEWAEFLMLDQAAEIFLDPQSSEIGRRATARKIMARVTSASLTNEQRAYARQLIGDQLGTVLRTATTSEPELGQFLVDLEAFEAGNSSSADPRINYHFQNFYWNHTPELQKLAEVFDNHYRNANFRIEVSERLVNRIAPRNMTYHEPVQDRILGAHVFGQSRINNQIQVQFIPDPLNLAFRLVSTGNVRSRTLAHSSGFTFNSLGNARVSASKGITINPQGVFLMPADVAAISQTRLLGIRSQLDGVPLVGWMARRVAEQQQQSRTPQANSIVEQKLRSEFGGRVDEEVQLRIAQARQWIADRILMPLNAMELEPTVITTGTTETTAVIRYRLAGLDQNAANTVRPQGLPDCLLNVQIHESAFNNLVNRIQINNQMFTAPEFMQHVGNLLGRDDLGLPDGEYEDVRFQFAARDALRMDFEDDRVAITLKLKKLQIAQKGNWRNLVVTAWYYPRASGLRVNLELDEEKGVSLDGYRLKMRDQLAVRTVFNALFKPRFDFPLLPPDLANRPATQGVAVSQLVVADGWVGISVSDIAPVEATADPLADRPVLRSARQLRDRWR